MRRSEVTGRRSDVGGQRSAVRVSALVTGTARAPRAAWSAVVGLVIGNSAG